MRISFASELQFCVFLLRLRQRPEKPPFLEHSGIYLRNIQQRQKWQTVLAKREFWQEASGYSGLVIFCFLFNIQQRKASVVNSQGDFPALWYSIMLNISGRGVIGGKC